MAAAKVNAALIGSGNIGTDLLYKALRSEWIRRSGWSASMRRPTASRWRASKGLKTTADGVDGLLPHLAADGVRIAFDATSAYVHAENARKLQSRGVVVIDLTPAAIGPYCVPPVNLAEHVGKREMNVNMVTCGGQATIPMVAAVSRVQPVSYGEIVATVASKSGGPGHAQEHRRVHAHDGAAAIEKVGGAKRGKAIIILNPAEPPLIMRDTIHCLTEGDARPRRRSPPRCTR